jgi:hypothetical protein
MNDHLKIFLKSIGAAALSLLTVNFIYLLVELTSITAIDKFSIGFKHGTFFLNDVSHGLNYGDPNANGFLLLIFIATIILFYNRRSSELTKS